MREAGAVAVAVDLSLVGKLDPLGEVLDAGIGLFAGAVPALGADSAPDVLSTRVADRVKRLWKDLGFSTNQLAEQVVITPACGLAGASPARARAVTEAVREAAKRLADARRRVSYPGDSLPVWLTRRAPS
jgi:hypothetical protein